MNTKQRSQIDSKYKWNISKIYNSDELWEEDFNTLASLIPTISTFKGTLNKGESLLSFLQEAEKVNRLYLKLYMFAIFKHHEDTGVAKNQAILAKIEMLNTNLKAATSFVIPELISIGRDNINTLINSIDDLKLYEKHLAFMLDKQEHYLSEEVEAVLAQMSDSVSAPENIYNALFDADIKYPQIINEKGEFSDLTDSNYSAFIRSSNREVREHAFKGIFNTLYSYKNMFSSCLLANAKNLSNTAKVRKYNSSIECAVDEDSIPVSVYNTTVDTVNKNLKSLHRYVALKKQLLGYEDIHMYDLYASVFDKPEDYYSFEEGVDMVKKALGILGDEYISIASQGIEDGWCDVYPNEGKRGGAYSWGSYDTMPYFLLNYVGELNDVFTLAHELGHSMHSYYSNKTQPFIYSEYTIFNAEVASITNEILLMHYLIENCKDKATKQYLIFHELEHIRQTVFRQTLFAEFEQIIHEKIDAGIGLSTDDICDIYYKLNVKYFGDDIVVDDEIKIEWARIPHFYSNFYVYKYVTGYAAANMFACSILNNEDGALDNYNKFLSAGGSDYSIAIQQNSGVDITTSVPMDKVIERFNALLDLLEETINN